MTFKGSLSYVYVMIQKSVLQIIHDANTMISFLLSDGVGYHHVQLIKLKKT